MACLPAYQRKIGAHFHLNPLEPRKTTAIREYQESKSNLYHGIAHNFCPRIARTKTWNTPKRDATQNDRASRDGCIKTTPLLLHCDAIEEAWKTLMEILPRRIFHQSSGPSRTHTKRCRFQNRDQ